MEHAYFNKYGAATPELMDVGEKVVKIILPILSSISDPVEARAVASFFTTTVDNVGCECVLRLATKMRKLEKVKFPI